MSELVVGDDVDLDEALQMLEAVVAVVDALVDAAGGEECRHQFCEGRYFALCRLPADHDGGHDPHPPASQVRDALGIACRTSVQLLEALHMSIVELVDLDVDEATARALVHDLRLATRAMRRAAALSPSSARATPPRLSPVGRRGLREAS